jgi:hypothetical protein
VARGHVEFWTGLTSRGHGDPEFVPSDDESVVVTWVEVSERF